MEPDKSAPAAPPAATATLSSLATAATAAATASTPAGLPTPQRVELASKADFATALDGVIGLATRTLRIFDPTAADFGFNNPRREEQLARFLRARRTNRLQIAVHDPRVIQQSSPRLMRVLRLFSHAIAIHRTIEAIRSIDDVLVIADDQHCIRRPHHERTRGVVLLHDPVETREWLNRFNAIWEQSDPSVNATTIGL